VADDYSFRAFVCIAKLYIVAEGAGLSRSAKSLGKTAAPSQCAICEA